MQEKERTPLNKRALVIYLLIALGFTWVCWIPAPVWADQGGYALPTIANVAKEPPFSFAGRQHLWLSLLFSLAVYGPFTIYLTLAALEPALGAPAAAVVLPALLCQTMSLIGMERFHGVAPIGTREISR